MEQITLYNYSELSDEAKKKARKEYIYSDAFQDRINIVLDEDMTKIFAEIEKSDVQFTLEYDLSSTQGSGVCFYLEGNGATGGDNLESILEAAGHEIQPVDEAIIRDLDVEAIFKKNNHHYAHLDTVDVYVQYDDEGTIFGEFKDMTEEEIEKKISEYENIIVKWYSNICNEMEHRGYELIDSMYDDSNIDDELADDDVIQFYEDGSMYTK